MQSVARDVGTLNKVLSNTKTRGILGELQLGQIIEDIMTASQYEREFVTVAGSSERVNMPLNCRDRRSMNMSICPLILSFLWPITTVWKMLMSLAARKRLSSIASLS